MFLYKKMKEIFTGQEIYESFIFWCFSNVGVGIQLTAFGPRWEAKRAVAIFAWNNQ